MLKILGLIGCLVSFSASADIYQWTDSSGKVHYSDTIPKDGKTKDGIRQRDDSNLPGITTGAPTEYTPRVTGYGPAGYEKIKLHIENPGTNAELNTCIDRKRRAVYLEKQREVHESEKINEWLWQNCRGYSNELRTIEQQMM